MGKAVAAATVNDEMRGSDDVPDGSKDLVNNEPAVTKEDATDIETRSEGRVMEDGAPSSTSISAIDDSLSMGAMSDCSSWIISSRDIAVKSVVSPSPGLAM